MNFRISVDTGGTFTDIVIADADGELHLAKALTTPKRIFQGIENALASGAADLGLSVGQLVGQTALYIYGTTRATNGVVESATARTALLTTLGFPDILVLKEGGKLNPHQLDVDYP